MTYQSQHLAQNPAIADVEALRGNAVLEFGTAWCPHCIEAQAHFKRAFDARGDIAHMKIEDGRGRPLGRSFRVKLWPTVVLLRDGEEIARMIRPRTAEDVQRALALLD